MTRLEREAGVAEQNIREVQQLVAEHAECVAHWMRPPAHWIAHLTARADLLRRAAASQRAVDGFEPLHDHPRLTAAETEP